jgi:outer membrane protein assembly factor BamB
MVKIKALSLLVAILLLAQSAGASTYPLTITPGRSWPESVVADSARGLVYFDATSGEYPPTGFSFGVINASTHEVIKVLPLDVNSGAMALDQENGNVFVAGNTTITVYDAASQTFTRQIDVGKPILSMAYDSSVSTDLFITSGYKVFAIDPQTGEVVRNATFANSVDGIVLDSSNGRLYVGQYPQGGISVLEAATLAPVGSISLPGCCALQFALDDRTQMLYAVTGTNNVYAVNTETDTFVKSFQVTPSDQNSTNAIAVDNMTGLVYVASSPGGSILEMNTAGDVVQHYQVQSQVAALAIDTKTQELYATNYHSITVYDAARSRTFLLIIFISVAVVAVGAVFVYLFIRRREEKERMEVQSGWVGPPKAR